MLFHLLTVILVILKVLGYSQLSWLWTIAPSLIMLAFPIALMGFVALGALVVGSVALLVDRKR